MAKVSIVGVEKLAGKLRKNATLQDVKRVVKHNGTEMESKIQANAEFTKGYQTGTTKRSVHMDIADGGMTAEAGPSTEYAPYLEHGTRFMDAQPFVKPGFDAQKKKFRSDLRKLMR